MPRTAVHQTLHGYSDGHRLIAGSLQVSAPDARTMLVMSDLSGPSVKPGKHGYLTGYPLDESGKYVLARTWAAPEMPRPGCVWTHSLIIDNADLARLTSAWPLLEAFRRPQPVIDRGAYSHPLMTSAEAALPPLAAELKPNRLRTILGAVYLEPSRTILAEALDAREDERLATEIWMQQWPRLRRVFGFCTLTEVNRSSRNRSLDLQFVPAGVRLVGPQFANSMPAGKVVFDPTLELLVRDLMMPGERDIRDFLRKVGGDVDGGRRAMVPMCKLYRSAFNTNASDLGGAIEALGQLDADGKRQARSVRALVAQEALSKVEHLDDEAFEFLLATLEDATDDKQIEMVDERLGKVLWERSPTRFVQSITDATVVGRFADQSLDLLAPELLISGMSVYPATAPFIVARRPELVERSDFWRLSASDGIVIHDIEGKPAGRIAAAMLQAGRSRDATKIIDQADAPTLAIAISGPADEETRAVWLRLLAQSPVKMGEVLASGKFQNLAHIVALARSSDPDAQLSIQGHDPWQLAIGAVRGSLLQRDEDYLCSFLMARGLGFRSAAPADLIGWSYSRLYAAMRSKRLPFDAERLATRRLGWGSWRDRDDTPRLVTAVVNRFVDYGLDPEKFGRITVDGKLTKELIDEAAETGRGRRYLDEVRKRLKHAKEKGIRERADYIAKIL